jgi:hypothetical protein
VEALEVDQKRDHSSFFSCFFYDFQRDDDGGRDTGVVKQLLDRAIPKK